MLSSPAGYVILSEPVLELPSGPMPNPGTPCDRGPCGTPNTTTCSGRIGPNDKHPLWVCGVSGRGDFEQMDVPILLSLSVL